MHEAGSSNRSASQSPPRRRQTRSCDACRLRKSKCARPDTISIIDGFASSPCTVCLARYVHARPGIHQGGADYIVELCHMGGALFLYGRQPEAGPPEPLVGKTGRETAATASPNDRRYSHRQRGPVRRAGWKAESY